MIIKNYLFHRVAESTEKWGLPHSPRMFEQCIRYIAKNHNVHTIEELMLEGHDLSSEKKIACITFDDGFKDNIDYAAEILKKYNVRATFYVTTDCLDNDQPTWTHLLPYAILETRKDHFLLNSASLGFKNKKFSIQNESERADLSNYLFNLLKTIPYSETQNIFKSLMDQLDDVEPLKGYMMNWDHIRQLKSEGHLINSHTKSHPFLATIDDDEQLKEEFVHSRNRIEKECGTAPRSLSYPVGSYNNKIKSLTEEYGYELGLAVNQKFYDPDIDDKYEIPRVDIYAGSGWFKTRLRLTGSIERLKRALGR